MKNLLRLAIILLVTAILAFLGHGVSQAYSLKQQRQLREAAAHRSHEQHREEVLSKDVSPAADSDLHIALPTALLNQMLQLYAGSTFRLAPGTYVEMHSAELTMAGAPPLIHLSSTVTFVDEDQLREKVGEAALEQLLKDNQKFILPEGLPSHRLHAHGIATLTAPVVQGDTLISRLEMLSLTPSMLLWNFQFNLAGTGYTQQLIDALARQTLDQMPEIQLPIRQDLPLSLQQQTLPLAIPLGSKRQLAVRLDSPSIPLSSTLRLKDYLFTPENIHFFLDLAPTPKVAPNIPATASPWTSMDLAQRQQSLEPPTGHYSLHLNFTTVGKMFQQIHTLPAEGRTLHLQSTGQQGYLDKKDGVEIRLSRDNALKVAVRMDTFQLQPKKDALGSLQIAASLKGEVDLRFNGTSFWSRRKAGAVRGAHVKIPLAPQTLSATLQATTTADGQPIVRGLLDPSQSLKLKGEFDLDTHPAVGWLVNWIVDESFNEKVPLPGGQSLFQFPLPNALAQDLTLHRPGLPPLPMKISTTQHQLTPTPHGISLTGKLEVQPQPPKAPPATSVPLL